MISGHAEDLVQSRTPHVGIDQQYPAAFLRRTIARLTEVELLPSLGRALVIKRTLDANQKIPTEG